MTPDLARIHREQAEAGEAYRAVDEAGERSRGVERWAEDWIGEEALVRTSPLPSSLPR